MMTVFFGALTGALVSFLILVFIFYPKTPVRFGPLTFQGAFQKAWPELIKALPSLIESESLKKEIVSAVGEADLNEEAAPLIDEKMELFFGQVAKQVPMAAMFLQGPLADALKTQARDQLLDLLPDLQKRAGERFAEDLDLVALFEKKLDQNSIEFHLEKAVNRKRAQLLIFGASVGAFMGLVQNFFI